MATLCPMLKFHEYDNNGDPLSGGSVYFYAAGSSSTKKDTYTTQAGSTANDNPVVLDIAGRATVFLGSGSYHVIVKDSAGNTIYDVDNVNASSSVGSGGTAFDFYSSVRALAEVTTSLHVIYVSGRSAANDGGQGWFYWDDTSLTTDDDGCVIKVSAVTTGRYKRILDDYIDVRFYGATGDGTTDDYSTVNAAHTYAYANNKVLRFAEGEYKIGSPLTITSKWEVLSDGKIKQNDVLTLTGAINNDPTWQIFSGSSTLVINTGAVPHIRPEWFSSFATCISTISTSVVSMKVSAPVTVSTNPTVPATCDILEITRDGVFNIATGCTLTINKMSARPSHQIFSLTGTGAVSFGDEYANDVDPVWFGCDPDNADNATALQACFDACGERANITVKIRQKLKVQSTIIYRSGHRYAIDCGNYKSIYASTTDDCGMIAWNGGNSDTVLEMINPSFVYHPSIFVSNRLNYPSYATGINGIVIHTSAAGSSVFDLHIGELAVFGATGVALKLGDKTVDGYDNNMDFVKIDWLHFFDNKNPILVDAGTPSAPPPASASDNIQLGIISDSQSDISAAVGRDYLLKVLANGIGLHIDYMFGRFDYNNTIDTPAIDIRDGDFSCEFISIEGTSVPSPGSRVIDLVQSSGSRGRSIIKGLVTTDAIVDTNGYQAIISEPMGATLLNCSFGAGNVKYTKELTAVGCVFADSKGFVASGGSAYIEEIGTRTRATTASAITANSQKGKLSLDRLYITAHYINWSRLFGSTGWGMRDNAGIMEYKNDPDVDTGCDWVPLNYLYAAIKVQSGKVGIYAPSTIPYGLTYGDGTGARYFCIGGGSVNDKLIIFREGTTNRFFVGIRSTSDTNFVIYDAVADAERFRIDSTGNITVSVTTDSTTKDTGSIITEGGIGVEKSIVSGASIVATTSFKVGANQVVGARGAALTAQLTSITHTAPSSPDYAIQDLTQTTPYGFATKDEGNTVLSVILNLQTRVAELEARLNAATGHGLIA